MRHMFSHSPFYRIAPLCLIMLSVLLFAGCPKRVIDEPEVTGPLAEAYDVFTKGKYDQAESMFSAHLANDKLPLHDKITANRFLSASAIETKHAGVAISALDNWRKLAAGADDSKEWQGLWARAMRMLPTKEARSKANDIYQNKKRSTLVRCISGVVLAARQWQDGELGQTLPALESIYKAAPTQRDKASLEQRLALELQAASPAASTLVAGAVTDANKARFPYNVILIDKLRRTNDSAGMTEFAKAVKLADPSLTRAAPIESGLALRGTGAKDTSASAGKRVPGQQVVLALPLTKFGLVSHKVVAGANVACDEMNRSGTHVQLTVIDTDTPNWIEQVNALPATATLLGGFVRRDDYTKAKAAGLLSKRAVFAFRGSLDDNEEGKVAWRFGSGAHDQIRSLLAFTSKLGIKDYAVFYPDEKFGQRMRDAFEKQAKADKATVVSKAYTPGKMQSWPASAKELLGMKLPGSPFKAIFLPGEWQTMEYAIPPFFASNEYSQVLMGTSLWEQRLSKGGYGGTPQYYELAVFPGAWNSIKPTASAKKLQAGLHDEKNATADFWHGIGYDFAHLVAKLGIRPGWTPEKVNKSLKDRTIPWSIAPITWENGVATQHMYLFQPVAGGGFKEVNETEFRQKYNENKR